MKKSQCHRNSTTTLLSNLFSPPSHDFDQPGFLTGHVLVKSFLPGLLIAICFLFLPLRFFDVDSRIFAQTAEIPGHSERAVESVRHVKDPVTDEYSHIRVFNHSDKNNSGWFISAADIDPVLFSVSLLERGLEPGDRPGAEWFPAAMPDAAMNYIEDSNEAYYLRIIPFAEIPDRPLAFHFGDVNDRDRTYFNGTLIGETGEWDAQRAQAYDRHRLYEIPSDSIIPGNNVLLVHVQGFTADDWGINRGEIRMGPESAILQLFYSDNYIALFFLIIYATVGSYFFFLFLRRRKEYENLMFGIFAYCLVIYQFLRNQMKYFVFDDFYVLKKIEYLILFLLVPIFFYFIRAFFQFPKTRFMYYFDRFFFFLNGIVVVLLGIVLFTDDANLWHTVNTQGNIPFLWPLYFSGMLGLLLYQLRRNRDAIYILIGMLIILLATVHDAANNYGIVKTPRVMSYAFVFFIVGLAVILANRFVRLNRQVEDLNRNLENKVEERTHALNESLNEVRALKVQQDGDYFLTSLLIKPLGENNVISENISVEMLTRQKKHFQFKKWNADIGGDFSAAHSITLRGKNYAAFVNADAMGKSMQGAGGALVLGTVFKAIITRTQVSLRNQDRSPEQWLKIAYIELQSVFTAFDGSMAISAVLGLVEDRTGFMYFINAEHPWVILYRNSKASFIEDELHLRKIGVDLESKFQVKTFQMLPNDVIISGSDGRDDIAFGNDESGHRIMNEDEQKFLQHVESSSGLLDRIMESLQNSGELTDDLSLVRIAYREDDAISIDMYSDDESLEVVSKTSNQPLNTKEAELLQDLRNQIKQGAYEKAQELSQQYMNVNPVSTEFLFLSSYILKLSRKRSNLGKAVDLAERCYLRDPEIVKNLVNLADLYRLLENYDRASEIIAEALMKEPGHEQALKLKEAIDEKREVANL